MHALCTYFLKLCGFDFKSAIKRVSIYPVLPYVDKGVDKKVKSCRIEITTIIVELACKLQERIW